MLAWNFGHWKECNIGHIKACQCYIDCMFFTDVAPNMWQPVFLRIELPFLRNTSFAFSARNCVDFQGFPYKEENSRLVGTNSSVRYRKNTRSSDIKTSDKIPRLHGTIVCLYAYFVTPCLPPYKKTLRSYKVINGYV